MVVCGFFYDAGIYSLPNCPYQIVAYQNVAFITYQIVTYQIVAYQNVAYQNVTYQIYLTLYTYIYGPIIVIPH